MRDCERYEAYTHLLESWHPDGSWGVDRLFMRKAGEAAAQDRALVQVVRNLAQLKKYLWNTDEGGYLDEAAELVLQRSKDDGYLQFISANARWAAGEHESVYRSDHWAGYAVAALIDLGVSDDRIDRFFEYLKETQRDDGGWLPEFYARSLSADSKGVLPSHPLHTAAFATALAAGSESKIVRTMLIRAVDFLLAHCFKAVGPYKRSSAGRWNVLASPDFGQSALSALYLAAEAEIGAHDPRVAPLLSWLKGKQEENGMWPVTKSSAPFPNEQLFLTLDATVIVKRLVDDLAMSDEESK
jgi:hypothetical protein